MSPQPARTLCAGARPPRRTRRRALLAVAALLSCMAATAPARGLQTHPPGPPAQDMARVLRHAGSESQRDARPDYPLDALRLALERAGAAHRLQAVGASMPQARSLRELQRGALDVVWTTPTPDRLRRLRVVPVPVDGGLIGWRLLLVRPHVLDRFSPVRTLDDLRPLRFAQGHDWPDVGVLRANGLQVSASPSYDGLFAMLGRDHVDAVPRGVSEVQAELREYARWPMTVEPGLALHYPNGLYFFVRRDDAALAETLERGLRLSLADGSLRRLFDLHYAAAIDRADLDRRRVLSLRNPALPAALADTLWFAPERGW